MKWLSEVVSKNKGWENFFAFFLLLMAVVASVFVALSVLGWTELLGSGAANWVQAFGSIAAIFGAAWLADRSHRRDRAERHRDLLYKEIKAINRVLAGADRVLINAADLETSFAHAQGGSASDQADELNSRIEMLKSAMDEIDEASGIWVQCYDTVQMIPRVVDKAAQLIALTEAPASPGPAFGEQRDNAIAMADIAYRSASLTLIRSACTTRDICRAFIANPSVAGMAMQDSE